MSFHAEDIITAHQVGVNREQCRKFYQISAFALPDVQGKADIFIAAYELTTTTTFSDFVLAQDTHTVSSKPTMLHVSCLIHEYPHFFVYKPALRPPGWKWGGDTIWWRNEWYTARY